MLKMMMFNMGGVRLLDQQGNIEADLAADLGRRHQTMSNFLVSLVTSCLRKTSWIFLESRVVTCRRWLVPKKLLLVWAWNEIKALPLPWFSGLAILLELVESTGTWPQGLLDAIYCHDS